jgi:hypothetical protein
VKNHLLKITSLGLVAVALALAPALTHAQDATTNAPAQTTPAPAPKKHNSLPFHGKVSAVDTGAETVTVGTLTLNITSTTRISNATNGEPAILSDIAVGENISGSYLTDPSGQLNAKTIHIGTKPGKHKKKKPAPADNPAASTNSVAPATN